MAALIFLSDGFVQHFRQCYTGLERKGSNGLLVFLQLMMIVIFGLKCILLKIFIRRYPPFQVSEEDIKFYKLSLGFIRKKMYFFIVLLI